uniref:Pseudouridine-5'-phosphatase isoform X1 n=1 Tax=Camelus bactrianus TaxID=9837 RepID=A0A9W3HPF0_CAMBA|nr:pseudouridine-5'-phosphatase isoform X1 [Camelus bactrianus]XP_045379309.1 pseudouridine-5'-phosphatase isoform X1 [Camelus bactrianus]
MKTEKHTCHAGDRSPRSPTRTRSPEWAEHPIVMSGHHLGFQGQRLHSCEVRGPEDAFGFGAHVLGLEISAPPSEAGRPPKLETAPTAECSQRPLERTATAFPWTVRRVAAGNPMEELCGRPRKPCLRIPGAGASEFKAGRRGHRPGKGHSAAQAGLARPPVALEPQVPGAASLGSRRLRRGASPCSQHPVARRR